MKLDADQAALYAAEEERARLARRQKPKTPIIAPGKPVRHTREASNVSDVSYVTNNEVVTAIDYFLLTKVLIYDSLMMIHFSIFLV